MDPEGEGFGRKLWIQIPLGNVYWIEWSCLSYNRFLVFMKIDREIQIHVFWSISDLYNVCLMIDDDEYLASFMNNINELSIANELCYYNEDHTPLPVSEIISKYGRPLYGSQEQFQSLLKGNEYILGQLSIRFSEERKKLLFIQYLKICQS